MTHASDQQNWRNASASEWAGRGLSGVFVAFMLFASALPKFFMPEMVVPIMEQLGWNPKYILFIGTIEVAGTLLYLFPRTAMLGAILLTGLLGGAIASQLRIEAPLFSHILFGTYLGLLMWGGLWLRDSRLRALIPFQSNAN